MRVSTVSEYVSKIGEIKQKLSESDSTCPIWFRGHSDESWKLVPGIYRGSHDPEYEREMIRDRDFKLNLHNYNDHVLENELELKFIMQHYGCPTRLLDWTESSLVALFFAVESLADTDGCVWVFSPWSLNLRYLGSGIKSVPEITHSGLSDYELQNYNAININRNIKGEYPVALRPPRKTPRILAQRGVFTVHGSRKISLDYLGNKHKPIKIEKIIIDCQRKMDIMRELVVSGITHSVLFPEVSGLAEEIKFKYSYA